MRGQLLDEDGPRTAARAAVEGIEYGPGWKATYAAAYNREYRKTRHGGNKRKELERGYLDRRHEKISEIKMSRGCADCGYNAHAIALDFDHINDDKIDGVSRMVSKRRPWRDVLAEVEKCEVVCANCHRVRTADRRTLCQR